MIYGIKNCETTKKARAWLDKRGVDYSFHDYKTAGIDRERLEKWCKKVGWGDAPQAQRHDVPQASGKGQKRFGRQKGRGVDARAAVHDQTIGA